MKNIKELWEDIPHYKSLYQASTLGNIKSKNGILKQRTVFNNKYLSVSLSMYGIVIEYPVHVLIAQTFLDFIPGGWVFVIDHIDEDTKNNAVVNLQILTRRDNVVKAIDKTKTYSKYLGVTYHSNRNKWYSAIKIDRKSIHLGTHETNQEYLKDLFKVAHKYRKMFNGDALEFRNLVIYMYIEEGFPIVDAQIQINMKDLKNLITKEN